MTRMELFNDDCFNVLRTMEDDSVDHIVTSPPYNRKRNDKYKNYNDQLVDYHEFLSNLIDEYLRVTREYVFFNIQKTMYNKADVFKLIGDYAEHIVEIIIWNKTNPMPASALNITNAYEFIIVLSKKHSSLKANSTYTKNTFTTNAYSQNPYKKVHRAVMHPEACKFMVDNFTKPEQLIFDPMMGVGTTGATCIESGRNFMGVELDPEYFEIASKRLEEQANNLFNIDPIN